MAIFVIVQTILMMMLSFMWSKNNYPNLFIKCLFTVCTVWGAYLLFGAPNLIVQFTSLFN